MKKFILTVIVGYLAVVALLVVTATLKGIKKSHEQKHEERKDEEQQPELKPEKEEAGGFAQKASSGNLKTLVKTEEIKKEEVRREFKTYYKNGRVSSITYFKDGKLYGVSEFYDENGNTWSRIPYVENKLSGAFEIKNLDKEAWLIWNFSEGVLHGFFSFFYTEASETLLSGEMKDGWSEGVPKFFSENGEENKSFYQLNSNAASAASSGFKLYNDQGEIKAVGSQSSSGEAQTELRTYFKNGKLSGHWILMDGVMAGMQTLYYPDGALRMELPFLKGALHGELKEYDQQGYLRWSAFFEEGQKQGVEYFYYSDRSLWSESKWQKGVLLDLPKVYSQRKIENPSI